MKKERKKREREVEVRGGEKAWSCVGLDGRIRTGGEEQSFQLKTAAHSKAG